MKKANRSRTTSARPLAASAVGEPMHLTTAGSIKKRNAAPHDIEEAFADDRERGEFVILTAKYGSFIQAAGEEDGPYVLEYRDHASGKQYQALASLSKEETKKAFLRYLAGDMSWQNSYQWGELNQWGEIKQWDEIKLDQPATVPWAAVKPAVAKVSSLVTTAFGGQSTSGCLPPPLSPVKPAVSQMRSIDGPAQPKHQIEYFEVQVPPGNGRCSDNACPCPEVTIPHGSGYLYIEPSLVEFRRQHPREADAKQAMERQLRERLGENMGGFYRLGPILVCEQGARLRKLDLTVAAADAAHWWRTGQVPLRPTPVRG